MAIARRTISLFFDSEDHREIVDFFSEFTPTIASLPPLSLSTFWKSDPSASCVGLEESLLTEAAATGDSTLRLIPVPELSYLQQTSDTSAKAGSSSSLEAEMQRQAHDPLGIVQKLIDIADNLSQVSTLSVDDRVQVLSAALVLAVKSGRASLILSCCHTLLRCDCLSASSAFDLRELFAEITQFLKEQEELSPSSPVLEEDTPLLAADVILK
jgi:hypothetical protein